MAGSMRDSAAIMRRLRNNTARLATLLVTLAYVALPTLGSFHQAQHSAQALAAALPSQTAIVSPAVSEHDASGKCDICQALARTKQAGGRERVALGFVHDDGTPWAAPDHEPLIGRPFAPSSARAPPLA